MPVSGKFGPKPAGRAFSPDGGATGGERVGRPHASSPSCAGGAGQDRPVPAVDPARIERLCLERGLKMTGQRRLIARVLSECSDHPDVATRLDSLALSLGDLGRPGDADRIVEDVSRPIAWQGRTLRVGVSVGIASDADGTATGPSDLLRRADHAMYQVKRQGRGGWVPAGTAAG